MKQEEAETADMPDTGAVDPTAEYECWLPPQGEVAFESEPVTDIAQTEDWDVVIVGMGAAGSAAAAYASANGLKTLVVEKMSVPAANPGDIFVINSKGQEQHQFPCPTFKDFMEALMTSSAYRANGPKLAALYHHSGEAFDWLYDNALVPAGIEAEPTFPAFPGIMMEGWTRCVNANITWVGGRNQRQADVHKSIADLALAQGAEIRFDTPAVQLVQDGNGTVTGVVVKGSDDAPHSALLNSYGIVDAHMMGIPALFIPWIRVNEQGRRFVNEEVPVSMLGGAIINQTHGRCWTVLDANYPQAAAQLKTAYLSNDPTMERAGYRVGFAVVVWSWFRPGRGCRWNKRCDLGIYLVQSRLSGRRAPHDARIAESRRRGGVGCWTAVWGKRPWAAAGRGTRAERETGDEKIKSEEGR